MSHITDVKLRVKNLDALEQAAALLDMELVRGQTTWKSYYGDARSVAAQHGQAEHAMRVKGDAKAYEIGLIKSKDGGDGWDLKFDSWGPGGSALAAKAGANLSRVRQEYAVAVALDKTKGLVRKGFVAKREALPSGVVRLRMVRR